MRKTYRHRLQLLAASGTVATVLWTLLETAPRIRI